MFQEAPCFRDGVVRGGTTMPDISKNQPKTATPRAHREGERPTTQTALPPEDPAGAPATLTRKGAFFRALLKAGCDAEVAYTAAEEVKDVAGENVVAHLTRLEQLVTKQGETLAEHGAKLDVLATRMDGLKTEMRLMWGALGALVTVLGLVFTLLFSR